MARRLHWLTVDALRSVHQELIARYGGVTGIRDAGLLESVVARPQQLATYDRNVTIAGVAAAYGWGILRNHPFADGNKRLALAAVVIFLDLNGSKLACSEAEETAMVLKATAGEISETDWNAWVVRKVRKKR